MSRTVFIRNGRGNFRQLPEQELQKPPIIEARLPNHYPYQSLLCGNVLFAKGFDWKPVPFEVTDEIKGNSNLEIREIEQE